MKELERGIEKLRKENENLKQKLYGTSDKVWKNLVNIFWGSDLDN